MPLNHSSSFAHPTDEQYQLIGKLLVEASNIEFLLGALLNKLLITPEFLERTYNDELTQSKLISGIEKLLKFIPSAITIRS